MLACTVCGLWYPYVGDDRLDICHDCYQRNFAGNPLESPTAREALEDYALAMNNRQITFTPRQAQAIARLAAVWHRQQAQEDTP